MDKNLNFEVGDFVQVFTVDEVKAYVKAGGKDFGLLECEEDYHDTAFGKIRKVVYVDKDGNVELKCEDGEFDYWYPEEILELVEEVSKMDKNLKFRVGDIVRVLTEEEVKAYVEAGGVDYWYPEEILELAEEGR